MSGSGFSRRGVVVATGALACAPAWAWAQGLPPPAPGVVASGEAGVLAAPAPAVLGPPLTLDDLVRLELGQDAARRMRVPVRVNGHGPFPFTVDTGADRTVISTELAAALGLPDAGVARVNGIAGVRVAPCTRVDRVEAGGVKLDGARLPLLPREGLGGLGLIGLDCLADQRMEIDFDRNVMELRRSRGFVSSPGEIVVQGKSRFGKLILVDSSVRRQPIFVVLDSGAQNTLGNSALRDLLVARRQAAGAPDPARQVVLESATGQTVGGETDEAAELTLGGVRLQHVPVIYADLHTFHLYGLEAEPALMLGMDVLRAFRRVWVDFGRREVGFQLQQAPFQGVSLNAFA